MKKIILDEETDEIELSQVPKDQAIIVREHGKFKGALIHEKEGWIYRFSFYEKKMY